jgi:hypothetical protein
MKAFTGRYPSIFRYNQMAFNPSLGAYKYIDNNICSGCATATACQSLLAVNGYNSIGDYAQGIYERAKKVANTTDKTGLKLTPAIKEALRTFNEDLEDHALDYNKLNNESKAVRDHLLNVGTVVVGLRWMEGMMYPSPMIPSTTPWYKKIWYYLRSPRYATNQGAKTGYHAVAVIGVDDKKQSFVLQNSYGTGYGNKGCVYIKYGDFNDVCLQAYGISCNPMYSDTRID